MKTIDINRLVRDISHILPSLFTRLNEIKRLSIQNLYLTLSETDALLTIENDSCMTTSRLASIMVTPAPNITRLVDSLVERNLVQRISHATDRRKQILSLTQKGKSILQKFRQVYVALLKEKLDQVAPENLAILDNAVESLKSFFEKTGL